MGVKALLTRKKRSRGQAVVELAIVFPFFLLIIVGGIVDFGFSIYNYLTLQQIVSDTASWGAENKKSDAEITEYANKLKPTWWKGEYKIHKLERLELPETKGNVIKLTITYETPMMTPFYQILLDAARKKTSILIAAMAVSKESEFLR
ncbi:MAG: pilus assembly protein [Candidatus Riflebacteria bacterium]|jgi:hypothetical protein|nr:pilus assembly protein [Candidatus Riflebacteria bacterium]